MQILGKIEALQRQFFFGGREVLRVNADLPTGNTPAAAHFLCLVQALCDYADRELFPAAADELRQAAEVGLGHRFAKRQYRIALSEASVGRRRQITLCVGLSLLDASAGENVAQLHRLETVWDEDGVLQFDARRKEGQRAKKQYAPKRMRDREKTHS